MSYRQHPLVKAARDNDADAEGGKAIEEILVGLGLDLDAVIYLAEQRAIRYVLIANGRADELAKMNPATPEMIPMSPPERAQIAALVPAYLDAIAIGWRGRGEDR